MVLISLKVFGHAYLDSEMVVDWWALMTRGPPARVRGPEPPPEPAAGSPGSVLQRAVLCHTLCLHFVVFSHFIRRYI